MTALTIAVSGINATDNPGPGTGVARSLREAEDLDVRIVGLAYDAMEPGIYMDLDFIIPTLDTDMPFFMKYTERLARQGKGTFVPTPEQFRLRGKDRLAEIAGALEIDLPETEVVASAEQVERAVARIGTPVMVKGAFYQAYKAHTTKEALNYYGNIVAEWGYPVLIQEVVSGDELNVVAVGDGTGGTLGRVAIKKMSITKLGKIWTGVTIQHSAMLEAAECFIKTYRWKGPMELECIVDDDQISLVEINPRFPAWSYFATGVGVNLPARMVRRALNLPEPDSNPGDYEAGKLFVRYTSEIVTDIDRLHRVVTTGTRENAH